MALVALDGGGRRAVGTALHSLRPTKGASERGTSVYNTVQWVNNRS